MPRPLLVPCVGWNDVMAMGHGLCGSWVNCVMGHMGHGSRTLTNFHLCRTPLLLERKSSQKRRGEDGDNLTSGVDCINIMHARMSGTSSRHDITWWQVLDHKASDTLAQIPQKQQDRRNHDGNPNSARARRRPRTYAQESLGLKCDHVRRAEVDRCLSAIAVSSTKPPTVLEAAVAPANGAGDSDFYFRFSRDWRRRHLAACQRTGEMRICYDLLRLLEPPAWTHVCSLYASQPQRHSAKIWPRWTVSKNHWR